MIHVSMNWHSDGTVSFPLYADLSKIRMAINYIVLDAVGKV